ncbi:MAG: hypothetical protein CMD82_00275 [Gammaproteobacteria bacterium]|nr:hypothetical protein [Gammaproteobacteria bacterium]
MKLKERKKIINGEDNMLPLVNIIFLLLIFFMIAGVIQKQKELFDVELGEATIDNYVEKEIHTIYIDSEGSVVLNDEKIDFGSFSNRIEKLNNKTELMIAADKDLTADRLNKVLLILSNQKIEKIYLMTTKKND